MSSDSCIWTPRFLSQAPTEYGLLLFSQKKPI